VRAGAAAADDGRAAAWADDVGAEPMLADEELAVAFGAGRGPDADIAGVAATDAEAGGRREPESDNVKSAVAARAVGPVAVFGAGADPDSVLVESAAGAGEGVLPIVFGTRREPESEVEPSGPFASAAATDSVASALALARAPELEAILSPGRDPDSEVPGLEADAHDPVVEVDFADDERRGPASAAGSRVGEPVAVAPGAVPAAGFEAPLADASTMAEGASDSNNWSSPSSSSASPSSAEVP
jgi:hypothetical protein